MCLLVCSLIMQLLEERRLDHVLLQQVETQRMLTGPSPLHQTRSLVEGGEQLVHSIYAQAYVDFHALWMERKPRDIMAFPAIFNEFKQRMLKDKYKHFRDDVSVFM